MNKGIEFKFSEIFFKIKKIRVHPVSDIRKKKKKKKK